MTKKYLVEFFTEKEIDGDKIEVSMGHITIIVPANFDESVAGLAYRRASLAQQACNKAKVWRMR